MKHLFPIILILLFLAGCTNNPQGRLPITGEVTLNGQPLENGSISFDPIGSQTERLQSGGQIVNGKYEIAAPQGLVPGEYQVRITSMIVDPKAPPPKDSVEPPKMINIVPPEFGSKTTQKVTVEKGKENRFDFKM
ncbi:MAG: carboxypeptidase-like regulatory domain-containing protein [Planctomycetaceae bacterium]|jgi:hypothetical protein|nr:carboxypeptidase-like regulatory domain-containing protein [Planctomycetaceae bacterium]